MWCLCWFWFSIKVGQTARGERLKGFFNRLTPPTLFCTYKKPTLTAQETLAICRAILKFKVEHYIICSARNQIVRVMTCICVLLCSFFLNFDIWCFVTFVVFPFWHLVFYRFCHSSELWARSNDSLSTYSLVVTAPQHRHYWCCLHDYFLHVILLWVKKCTIPEFIVNHSFPSHCLDQNVEQLVFSMIWVRSHWIPTFVQRRYV